MSAGAVIVGGFAGLSLPASFERSLRKELLAGAILFKRNITGDMHQVAALNASIASSMPRAIIAVDQEGGRVARLGSPFLRLPAARTIAARGIAFVKRAAAAQAAQLRALGFTLNFAPVLDVHSEPDNPIIGDRAFSTDPHEAGKLGTAFGLALQEAGILACGKHFPGHGDTTVDSHLALPTVTASRETLNTRELLPFQEALELASLMTAHVVYPALDAENPATLSRAIATDLLRDQLGYQGALFSDDLEMKAIHLDIEASAVLSIAAGCDLLLVCSSEEWQERAYVALTRESEKSDAFRARLQHAAHRARALAARVPHSSPLQGEALMRSFGTGDALAIEQEFQ